MWCDVDGDFWEEGAVGHIARLIGASMILYAMGVAMRRMEAEGV